MGGSSADIPTEGPDVPSGPGLSLQVIARDFVAVFPLPADGVVVIGRSEEADIRIDHRSISRRHAALHLSSQLAIEDLGSSNGTKVGQRVLGRGERAPLSPGDTVDLGSILAIVQRGAAVAAHVRAAPAIVLDPEMKCLYELIDKIAVADVSVVLLGETGVGKEVIAEAVHQRSRRTHGPFLGLNCAALTEPLLESELFGHEKGAFTGAHQAKQGLLETAARGTVFLDEIGEMPLAVQAKLLRVLEAREVLRVGSVKPRPIDVRFLCATNRDLVAEVERGNFRRDLYYRLNGVSIAIPPLRQRPSEIVPLARSFVAETAQSAGRARVPELSPEVVELLERYPWPGNIRELRNVIARAVLVCTDGVITARHVSFDYPPAPAGSGPVAGEPAPAGRLDPEAQRQRDRIVDALTQCAGNQTRAARMLGVSRGTLVSWLETYRIPRPRKRSPFVD